MFGLGKKKKDAGELVESAEVVKSREGAAEASEAPQGSDIQASAAPVTEAQTPAQEEAAAVEQSQLPPEFQRDQGPWDISEQRVGSDYIDLGGLLVKSHPGLNLRLEADQKSQQVIAVTMQLGEGTLQVQAFAAPKSRGLWDEIRRELSESVRRQGGQVDINDGSLGRQLISRVPAALPDGRQGFRIARFVGVDGPRWFLRGVFSGKAVMPGEVAAAMEEIFRSIVVNRGSAPMPPRDLLPMRVPQALQEAAREQAAQQAKGSAQNTKPTLEVPRRGPEITEIG